MARTNTNRDRGARRARWLAAVLRGAYDMDWVPLSVVANLSAVEVDRERGAVILTLHSGTRLIDRGDRIDVVGVVDDITVDELVAVVVRRGWMAVEVHGDPQFRRAMSICLQHLEPPVTVSNSPLTADEQMKLQLMRDAREDASPQGPVQETAAPRILHL